ncbi:membrane-bound lytic murein transglycosylase B [Ketogulonicigenium vulgare Y25]|uniref:Membrane-bound lytic murein transglycosylase B n=1 Tax=Ketogulonicigenium vulgare (strain WSH-001) TaxID=759362 RepID=F9Y5P6_KETVW|nr:lytic murein transglycosylase [Ketogulonicigenium vulgare]ADO43702.1 membrane-bound lytic murein transglycosylase B [Ketogulonicigenium vulgare Y25]AEM41971.1 Membrane-bound lytic murein transglycosylase B [Ketogulonicigenium vulgare WSH-001]ALJ82070.1 murein transglycosylase [Ketogulonicigenium vulgare]AOZ55736.1 membrane-bound lytic murein transglycosylase B [Ketogulonicigenium vulgare]
MAHLFRSAMLCATALTLTGCGWGNVSANRWANAEQPAASQQGTSTMRGATNAGYLNWQASFRPRALAAGISARTFDAAFRNATYLPNVVENDRNQAEFTRALGAYLSTAASDARVENGRAMLAQHANLLSQIEQRYGVDRHIVVAVWGMESNYGARRGDVPIISALSTLAYDGRRASFFENQLIAALRIIQANDTDAEHMLGSWAGAMGHTQFMPTSFLEYAVDFRGDGRRDIWSDDPTDGLASTAAYLSRHGWVSGQPWGVEVRLPSGFNYALTGKGANRPVSEWAAMGVRAANGNLPGGEASILLPTGANGPAIMIFRNFTVISRYNASDSYVIGVGHLADRLRGGPRFSASFPDEAPLNRAERTQLQERLTRAGYNTGGADGILGSNSLNAIRAYQRANGLTADGYPSRSLLERLR